MKRLASLSILVLLLVVVLDSAHAQGTYTRIPSLPVQSSPDSTYSIPASDGSGNTWRIPYSSFGAAASDTAFGSGWNAVTTIPPTKNAVYDALHLFDTDDDGKVNVLDIGAGFPETNASGVISLSAFTGTFASLTSKPTTLSGYGITDGQPLDSDLTALAAAAGTNSIYYRSGLGTWPAVTIGNGLSFSGGTLALTTTAITGQTEDTSPDRANDFVLTYDVSASALKKAKISNFSGDVTAASAFGTDNRLIRSNGTGKDIQASGITIDDSDNMSGVTSISATDADTQTFKILDAVDQSHGLSFIVASDLVADKTFTYTGAFNFGMTLTADTSVILPISGTLLSSNFPMNGVGLNNSSYYRQTGIISPTLSGDVNDWSPTGLATASIIRIDPGAANRNITGIAAQPDGTIIELQNISSTANRTITLKDSSSSSSSANRFLSVNDLVISGSKAAIIWYDGTTAQWRSYGRALINSGVSAGTYGSSGQVGVFQVGVDGIITSASNTAIDLTALSATNLTSGTIPDARYNASGLPIAVLAHKADDATAIHPITVYVKGVTVLTGSGTPADIATITVPAGITRWHVISGNTSTALAETASGTLAGASFTAFDAASGGGTQVSSAFAGPTNTTSLINISANSLGTFYTSSTIVIRQTALSANAGTMSFYITLYPIL